MYPNLNALFTFQIKIVNNDDNAKILYMDLVNIIWYATESTSACPLHIGYTNGTKLSAGCIEQCKSQQSTLK